MKSVPSKLYDKKYFLQCCGGYEEFLAGILALRFKKCLSFLDVKRGDKILDAGCGRGEGGVYCALKGADVVGIDYAKDSIKISNQFSKKYLGEIKNNGGKILFLRENVKGLPFNDKTFDKIICFDLIEHLYESEQKKMLSEFKRVMKDDSVLLIHTLPNLLVYKFVYPILRVAYPFLKYIKPIRSFINTNPTWRGLSELPKNPRSNYEKEMHIAEQTPSMLRETLKKAGFQFKIYSVFQTKVSKNKLINLLGFIAERIPILNKFVCINIIVVARKQWMAEVLIRTFKLKGVSGNSSHD